MSWLTASARRSRRSCSLRTNGSCAHEKNCATTFWKRKAPTPTNPAVPNSSYMKYRMMGSEHTEKDLREMCPPS